jgi:hypothetical protein
MTASMPICFGNIAVDENEGEKIREGSVKNSKRLTAKYDFNKADVFSHCLSNRPYVHREQRK